MRSRIAIPAVLIFVLFLPVFLRIYLWSCKDVTDNDHSAHLFYLRSYNIPTYPLFHITTLILSGLQMQYLEYGAALTLALATAATAALSARFLSERSGRGTVCVTALCLGLAIARSLGTRDFALTNYDMQTRPDYAFLGLGDIKPNILHNPTTIFAMPFALGLFLYAVRHLRRPSLKSAFVLSVLMVVSTLAKPNYVLAFAPCLVLAVLAELGPLADRVLRIATAFALPVALLYVQSKLLGGSAMVFSPFTVWQRSTPSIPVSILVGLAFPLSVLLSYPGRFEDEIGLKLAWAVMVSSIVEFATFVEPARALDNNWHWGMHIADHILFLVSCEFLLRQPNDRRKLLCYGFFLAHCVSGTIYLGRHMISPAPPRCFNS
jgi:hypothetical protein